jgi:hypothetical protein
MLYELTVIQFSKMLKNLSAILEKGEIFAETKKLMSIFCLIHA